jgi:flagellar biogenesis protein FliO
MSSVFGASAILSTLLPLAVILGVLLVATYVARRVRGGWGPRRAAGNAITIVATRPVGPGAALMIIEADGQRFLVSSGRQGITPIGALGSAPAAAFSDTLETAQSPAPNA